MIILKSFKMKKIFFVLAIFSALKVNSQDRLITFAGAGASTTVVNVKVENLTSGATLTLNGSDILRLTGSVGIPQLQKSISSSIKVFPNPMTESSTIELSAIEL